MGNVSASVTFEDKGYAVGVSITAGQGLEYETYLTTDEGNEVYLGEYSDTLYVNENITYSVPYSNHTKIRVRVVAWSDDSERDFEKELTPVNPDEDTLFTYTVSGGYILITGYNGSCEELIIPSKIGDYEVYGIGAGAFKERDRLTSVVISDGIISIGNSAFQNCTNLESITIPVTVTYIGDSVFYGSEDATIYYDGTRSQWNDIDFKESVSNEVVFKGPNYNIKVKIDNNLRNVTNIFYKQNSMLKSIKNFIYK